MAGLAGGDDATDRQREAGSRQGPSGTELPRGADERAGPSADAVDLDRSADVGRREPGR